MTVSTTNSSLAYSGNGTTATFSVSFQFFGADELKVYKRVSSTGVETLQTESTHYSVTGGSGLTGAVTFVTAPLSTETIHIFRETTRTQGSDFTPSQRFPSASVERGLDRVVMSAQDTETTVEDRALMISRTDPSAGAVLPNSVTRANKVLGFDSAGVPTMLENLVSGDAITATGSTTARTHAERWGEVANVKDFGAKGDGVTLDTVAIQAAIDSLINGGELHFPAGTYIVGGVAGTPALTVSVDGVRLRGASRGSSKIQLGSGEDCHVLDVSGTTDLTIEGLWIDGDYTNQTLSVHGIRSTSSTDLTIRDVKVSNCRHYGIGMQTGSHVNTVISDVVVENTGSDGIDFKNVDHPGTDNSFIRIDNLVVKNPGLVTNAAALDIRGRFTVNNYFASVSVDGASGIRFRGNTADGGQTSSLSNFHIASTSATETTSVGVNVTCDDVQISNGHVGGYAFGVLVTGGVSRGNISGVSVEGSAAVGFQINSAESRITLVGCRAIDCTTSAFRVDGDNCQLIACSAKQGSGTVVNVTGNADGTCVVGGDYTDTAGASSVLLNSGANTTVSAAKGIDWGLEIADGVSAPTPGTGMASVYVDSADGDLKVKFSDGTVKTIATDT